MTQMKNQWTVNGTVKRKTGKAGMKGGRVALAGLTLAMLALAGCGGGGGGSSSAASNTQTNAAASKQIRGTAASGAAIIGTVTLKDANGQMVAVQTDSLGRFTIDVTGLTSPYMLKVEGEVGGRAITLYSAATDEDVDGPSGVVNITTLTDLVTSNALGGVPSSAFDAGAFGILTKRRIDQESQVLVQKIATILDGVGLTSTFDPRKSEFEVQNSPEDKVLDLIKVSYNDVSQVATIKNIADGQEIADDLTINGEQEMNDGLTGFNPAGDFQATATDIDAVRAAVNRLNVALATPNTGENRYVALMNEIPNIFRFGGMPQSDIVNQLAAADLVGARITDVEFVSRRALSNGPTITKVNMVLRNADGVIITRLDSQVFIKYNDVYAWAGDVRPLELGVENMSRRRMVKTGSGTQTCYETGIDFTVSDPTGGQSASDVSYVTISGPGLIEPVNLFRSEGSDRWTGPSLIDGHFLVLNTTCEENAETRSSNDAAIRRLPSNGEYSVVAYGANNVMLDYGQTYEALDWKIHTHGMRPQTTDEIVNAGFASVANLESIFGAWGVTGNGSLATSVNVTGLNQGFQGEVSGRLGYIGFGYLMQSTQAVGTMGNLTVNLNVDYGNDLTGYTLDTQEISVITWDNKGRQLVSTWVNVPSSFGGGVAGPTPIIPVPPAPPMGPGPQTGVVKSMVKRVSVAKAVAR